ncbi:MAG: hypothetical protein LKK00_02035 [Intestinimonas sp.]|jgi:uncharacterized protein YcaQ|nr:hypothetical protein [Intestinimonas sp.]
METIQNFILFLVFAVGCGTLAWLVKTNKQRVLSLTEELIQKAESAVQGSGLGEKKKALVIAQLEAAGVQVTSWLSDQIDVIVAALNSKGAWLAGQVQEAASSLTAEAASAATGESESHADGQ